MTQTVDRWDHHRPLDLHPLVYLADDDEVTIGRPDIDSYGIFPPDGAELVRRLAAGEPPSAVARWYETEYGEPPDLEDAIAALGELGFLRDPADATTPPRPVRWQRLGAALFSWPAWLGYALCLLWAAVAMVQAPDLRPSYRNLFFTDYLVFIELTLFLGTVPMLVLHESFHVLAARRLGVRSRLRISQRLYYVVLETSLDGLVAVPRRRRYLPILAGMLIDLVAVAVFTIAAALGRQPDGALSGFSRVCLALAFATLLRLAWQFFFYLRTDLYVLGATLLGCVDLHTTARRMLANRLHRLLRRRERLTDESRWHPVDRRAARWYSWLIVVGYTTSITTFAVAVWPAVHRMFASAFGRLATGDAGSAHWVDAAVFLAANLGQVALTVWLWARERRQRRSVRFEHVIA